MRTNAMPTSWLSRAMILVLAVVTAGFSCESGTAPRPAVTFRFQVREAPGAAGQFLARTNDLDVIRVAREQLELPVEERERFINGPLAHGDGGHNDPWSWFRLLKLCGPLRPSAVTVPC